MVQCSFTAEYISHDKGRTLPIKCDQEIEVENHCIFHDKNLQKN